MRRSVIGWLVMTLATLMPAMAVAGDQEIANHIVQKLKLEKEQGKLKGFGIDMHVDQGTVWFQGHVATPEQKQLVMKTAQEAKQFGLVQIVDDINIKADSTAATVEAKPVSTGGSFAPSAVAVADHKGQFEPKLAQTKQIRQVSNTTPVAPALGSSRRSAPSETQVLKATPVASNSPKPAVSSDKQQIEALQRQVEMLQKQMQTRSVQTVSAPMPVGPGPVAVRPIGTSVPLAMAPAAQPAAYQGGMPGGMQMPAHLPASASNMGAQHDNPQLPGYAWPAYAAHPNYAGVTYPKSYSPTAWPYIGPFYPYPQVPLGWRKVTLEWDDGWWQLDFADR